MERTRLSTLAGVLAVSVVLVAGCSDPAPPAAPGPSVTTVPSASASPSASPSATPTPTSAPSSAGSAPAPQPSASGDGTVVPSRPVRTAPPKKLDQPTKTAGAQVSLASVRATTIKAKSQADSSGPGVLIRLKLVNTTGKSLDTSFVQVNVDNGSGDPGTLVSGSPTDPLTGSLKAGGSGTATYAFLLGGVGSTPVTVSVYVTSGQPVVTFRGQAS